MSQAAAELAAAPLLCRNLRRGPRVD